ncbi:MAG: sulfite exporter TauE/SafE family protein [Rhodospirillales bacterium]|nr:sulfite exporter TauE/SafE family protein [Rhodospirillales bacterium]
MTETILATLDLDLAVALLVAIAAGMAHGFTGFGGALVAMPLYTVLFGPVEALAILVFAGVVGSAQLTLPAMRIARWPHLIPMMAAAIIFTPLGVLSLVTIDPDLIRRAIGILVLLGALVIGFGWTYKGPRNTATGAAAGALAGYLTGATGMGGPPLAAYMLAFPDPADVQRANIVLMTALLITTTLIGLIVAGSYHPETIVRTILLTPVYMFGAWWGGRLFHSRFQTLFRRVAIGLLVAGGIIALAA